MGANKFEAFTTEKVHRSRISGADYNPRKISDKARDKLKKFIRRNGLWQPLVWNERTGTLVSGHQRLAVLDALMKTDDYELTVARVDSDEKTEASANVFMNNTSAMGEWDLEVLAQFKDMFPDIDFVGDLGFEPEEVSMLVDFEEVDFAPEVVEVVKSGEKEHFMADTQKKARHEMKSNNDDGVGPSQSNADYTLTVVFGSASEKRKFNELLDLPPGARMCPAEQLLSILE